MNLRAIVGNALHGAASALGNVTQTHQPPPAANPPAKTSAANTGTLTDKQVKEIAEHIVSQRAQPSLFEEQVKQIDPQVVERRHIYDQPVTVELPKPSAKMTKADYDQAFARAVLKQAGMADAKDAEVAKFRNEYRRVTGGKFELTWNEQQLRAYQKQHGNQLPAHTSDYGLSVADAGMRQIHADRQEYAVRVEQRRKEAQAYGTDALTGFYEVQMNAPINLINDATKIVGIPEIPKFEVGGEYWKDKKGAAEATTTAAAAVLTGGAGLASDLLIIGSSAGNMAEAATGEDMRTGEQLSTADRVLRGASGAVGGYAVRGRVGHITDDVAARVNNVTKSPPSTAEAVTAEGVTMHVPAKHSLEKVDDPMMVKMHGNMPSEPLNPPANRHYLTKVTEKSWTKAENTVIEPWVDVKADVAAINAGKATRTGNSFEINGRTYGVESNGTLYPISGSGFHSLDRKAYNALKLYKKFGDTPRVAEILDNMGVNSVQREAALKAWKAGGGK